MLKRYKNELLNAIQNAGINPSLFDVNETKIAGEVLADSFTMELRGSGLSFTVRTTSSSYHKFDCLYVVFAPHRPVLGPFPDLEFTTFEEVLDIFRSWLKNSAGAYLHEVEAPDLWSIIGQEGQLSQVGGAASENTPFTPSERESVRASLGEVREYVVQTQELSPEAVEFIDSRLKYLEEASQRMGRKDWINMTVGVLSNIVVGAALAPEAASELFRVASQAFMWLINTITLLPG